MNPPEASARDYRCSYCPKVFGRAEHLRRHTLIHNELRPFRCQFCTKDFIRRDALQRHQATHNASPSLLKKGGRACSNCAAAKVRCSGETLCLRCRDRGLRCSFPSNGQQHGGTRPTTSPSRAVGVHMKTPEQTPVQYQAPMQAPGISDSGLMNLDFWDNNVLSSTNWLEVLDPGNGFAQFSFAGFPNLNDPFSNRSIQSQSNTLPATAQHRIPNGDVGSYGNTDSPASVFSSHSNVVTDSITSHGSQEDSATRPGEYYVDGESARLPRVKRRKLSSTKRSVNSQAATTLSLRVPDTLRLTQDDSVAVKMATYSEIQSWYQRLAVEAPAPWPAFEPASLPALGVFEYLIGLYFKHFDQILPFLHRNIFRGQSPDSVQLLAMAALGSHHLAEEVSSTVLTISMHELVRRCLVYLQETFTDESAITSSFMAAELLHFAGAAYSGDQRLTRSALDLRRRLAAIHESCMRNLEPSQPVTSTSGSCEEKWRTWSRREGTIRLAHSSWLLDCMMAYQFQSRAVMNLKDAAVPLPCHEKLWSAESAEEWALLLSYNVEQPTLNTALQELYVDKKLPRDRGEFARIIIIHGLYQRQWEVEWYHESPLSQWIPTASRQSSTELLPKAPMWPQSVPTFSKWQNSACDALDILHWQANSTIGQASGLEHPTVLHLHLARSILLTPYGQIVDFARSMINGTANIESAKAHQQTIQRWAIQHQYKARLAVIHAGVVFWHVRRYSIDALYEAPAVGLAALVLWAFGTFTNRQALSRSASRPPGTEPTAQVQSPENREDSDHSDECEIILIDRPTDDELVQQFIRNGHTMRAHLTGVGDLYAAKGPERALMQGCKLLSSLRCWGVSNTWLLLLQGLVDVSRKARANAE